MIVIGTKCQLHQPVTQELTAAAVGSGALPVFGTPFMCALMENAAMTCLQSFLEEGLGSVGTRLEVSHDAPTPVGMEVWAEAEITAVSENGKMVDFAVRAWDERGPIGSGVHTRAIIKNEKFLAKCNAQAGGLSPHSKRSRPNMGRDLFFSSSLYPRGSPAAPTAPPL